MYTEKQVQAVAVELQDKIVQGRATEQEIILLVLILEKTKKITVEQVSDILMIVFNGDKERILEALNNARNSVTDTMIDEIIGSVHKDNPSK